jgi:membrane-bound lytic murein transglycosylase D
VAVVSPDQLSEKPAESAIEPATNAAPQVAEVTILSAREDDLWMRIRAGFALADLDTPLVKSNEAWYADRPDYVQRMTERSQLYLFHIVEEVDRRKLPSEIALLPMIESAFNPTAYSRSQASGIWQFIPSTGKHFGLDQNWWYDGRRNVLSATNAALDYLEMLRARFGSWELALAAYNCGEGCVARAMATNQARGLPTDFLSLNLPNETRNYVPKLLAIKNIIADPDAYGLKLNDVPNKPFFTTVEIKKHIDTALAARFADMTKEEFIALNPAFTKPVITHNDNQQLLLPTTKLATFNANMQRYGEQQLHTWQAYQARAGEPVDKIAAKFHISSRELRALNSIKEKRGKLKTAQLLLVPLHLAQPLPTAKEIATTQVKTETVAENAEGQSYEVQTGDTLYALAKRFNTTTDAIAAQNNLESDTVKAGNRIQIPADATFPKIEKDAATGDGDHAEAKPAEHLLETSALADTGNQPIFAKPVAPAKATAAPRPAYYTIKRGDTLHGIARTFKVTIAQLMQWNNLGKGAKLTPGAKVQVYQAAR